MIILSFFWRWTGILSLFDQKSSYHLKHYPVLHFDKSLSSHSMPSFLQAINLCKIKAEKILFTYSHFCSLTLGQLNWDKSIILTSFTCVTFGHHSLSYPNIIHWLEWGGRERNNKLPTDTSNFRSREHFNLIFCKVKTYYFMLVREYIIEWKEEITSLWLKFRCMNNICNY